MIGTLAAPCTPAAIRAALETAGVEFTNGDQPGVKLRKAEQRQQSGAAALLPASAGR